MLFFVSVGMLFDPAILVARAAAGAGDGGRSSSSASRSPPLLSCGRSASPLGTALTISPSLAQIGEFSFILAGLGVALGLLPQLGRELILAGAIISIVLNPLLFMALDRLRPWLDARDGAKAVADAVAADKALNAAGSRRKSR